MNPGIPKTQIPEVENKVALIRQRQEQALESEMNFFRTACPEIDPIKLRSIVTVAFYAGTKVMLHNL